jgi:hypothetical protein
LLVPESKVGSSELMARRSALSKTIVQISYETKEETASPWSQYSKSD